MSRLDHPHGDACPNCGAVEWGFAGDDQCCGNCHSRICPVCGADFAEDYVYETDRVTDNMGDHMRQWHPGVRV